MSLSIYPVLLGTALANFAAAQDRPLSPATTAGIPVHISTLIAAQADNAKNVLQLEHKGNVPKPFRLDREQQLAGIRVAAGSGQIVVESPQKHLLLLGSQGIDMQGSQDALLLDCMLKTVANQLWKLSEGSFIRLGSKQKAQLQGEHVITVSGPGRVEALQGNFSNFKGKWRVEKGATLSGIGLGNVWGSNSDEDSISLQDGTLVIGGWDDEFVAGNWQWNNNIQVPKGSKAQLAVRLPKSYYDNTRRAVLWGSISGEGSLRISNLSPKGVMSDDNYGIIIGGDNPFSGELVIDEGSFVRIGVHNSVKDYISTANAGNSGKLGSKAKIVNNGVLRLSRNDSWEFANQLEGSGELKLGCSQGDCSSQIVDLVGHKSYSGNTVVQGCTLLLGSQAKLYTVPAPQARLSLENGATLEIDNLSASGQLGTLSPAAAAKYFNDANIIVRTAHTATHNFSVGPKGAKLSFNLTGMSLKLEEKQHGNIELGGDLHFDTASTIELAKNIVGSGNVYKSGRGTLVMRGNYNHRGALNLQQGQLILEGDYQAGSLNIDKNGVLQLENQAKLSKDMQIDNRGQIFCNMKNTLVLDNKFKGTGQLLLCEGDLKIDNCKKFYGKLLAHKGTVRLNGDFSGSILEVGSEAQLRGDGQILGECRALGSIEPGDADKFGSLRFDGDFKIDAGATVVLRIKSEQGDFVHDSLRSKRNIELGGLIIVSLQGECSRKPQVLHLIKAANINGSNFDVSTQLLLPPAPAGLVWNTDAFLQSGAVALVSEHSNAEQNRKFFEKHNLINTVSDQGELSASR